MKRVGVLALQGAFAEHLAMLKRLEVEGREVRSRQQLAEVEGLIIPGGESTTIAKLMRACGLLEEVRKLATEGFPVWGVCAGMILMAKKATDLKEPSLGIMDIEVRRNAYGRQVDSFETELFVPRLGEAPFRAIFIRAPLIENIGPSVEKVATLPDGTVVAANQGNLLATAFHPELTDDPRLHSYFLSMG